MYITGWDTIFGLEILPKGFAIDINRMIKTPYAQSTEINPWLLSLLNGPDLITRYVHLISTDFVTAEMSCAIVNQNVKRNRMKYSVPYTYSGNDRVMTGKEKNRTNVKLNIDTDELAASLLADVEYVHGSISWAGDPSGRHPSSLTVRLYRQIGSNAAQEVDQLPVKPDQLGRWNFDFGLYEKQINGQPVTWSVRCDIPDQYCETVNGYQITLTRKKPLPVTGDATDPMMLSVLLAVSLTGLLIVLNARRRRKNG